MCLECLLRNIAYVLFSGFFFWNTIVFLFVGVFMNVGGFEAWIAWVLCLLTIVHFIWFRKDEDTYHKLKVTIIFVTISVILSLMIV